MEHGFSEVIWGHILEGIFNMTSHQPLTKLFAVPLRRKRFAASPSPVQQLEADNRFQLQSLSFNRGRYTSTVSCTTSRCAQVRSRPPAAPRVQSSTQKFAPCQGAWQPPSESSRLLFLPLAIWHERSGGDACLAYPGREPLRERFLTFFCTSS